MDGENDRIVVWRVAGPIGPSTRSQPDQKLLASTSHTLDLAISHSPRKGPGIVATQRRRPVAAGANDPRTRDQAAQVAGDGFDFGQFGHH
jgi:hypothetical protein